MAFAIAFIMDVFDLAKGHVNWVAFMLIGFVCLAVHLVTPWGHRGTA